MKGKPHILFFLFLAIALVGAIATPALADHDHVVTLHWGILKEATLYEIRISKDDKVVNNSILSKDIRRWEGKFGPGIYMFEVRAIDRFERAGEWTDSRLFFIPPEPPKISSPANGLDLKILTKTIDQNVRWNSVPSVSAYHVEVKQNGQPLIDQTVRDSSIDLKKLSAGEYSVRVRSVLESNRAYVKTLGAGKVWESLPSDSLNFWVIKLQVATPKIEAPTGLVPPKNENNAIKSNKTVFSWQPAENATAYRIKVTRLDRGSPNNRRPAGDTEKSTWTEITHEPRAEIEIPPEGEYKWEVLPQAETKNAAEPLVSGNSASANFKIQGLRETFGPSLKLSVALGYFPYAYTVNSGSTSFNQTTHARGSTLAIDGSFWLSRHWGFLIEVGNTFAELASINTLIENASGLLGFRSILFGKVRPLSFYVGVGPHVQQNIEVLPPTNSGNANLINELTLGPVAELGLHQEIFPAFDLDFKFRYFLQRLIVGGGTYSSLGAGANDGMSADLSAAYWLNLRCAIQAGISWQNLRANYLNTSGSSETATVQSPSYHLGIQFAF